MKNISLIFFLLSSMLASSQDVFMQNGTVNRCSGVFYDSGGGGADYGANETYVLTICPENAGQKLQLNFTSFSTQLNTDFLTIYDGNSMAAPLFGAFAGGSVASPGLVIATSDNVTGCITLEFTSDGTNGGPGWAATISCLTPCQIINSQIDSATPAPNSLGYIRVCPDEPITLTGSGSFSVDGTGATYEWDLGDGNNATGQTATFSYPDPGVYIVNLYIRDTNTSIDPLGCRNNNLTNQVIQVATEPDFSGTLAAQSTLCFGETTIIAGVVNPVPFINDCTPPISSVTSLPDGTGVTYETSVVVDCYDAAQTLTDINQLVSICLTMEHSYLGDLDIEIVSPNGRTVRLHNQGGDSANLGTPWATAAIDQNSTNTTPGVGAQYCFVPGNANPTLVGGIQMGGTFPNGNGPGTYNDSFVPAGNYSSEFSLTGLVGSPLNGSWTIRIVDNLPADNGNIFAWGIEFNPALQPPELSFSPVITSASWDADATIINTTANMITVQPPTEGTYCYTYRVTDNFGCEYTEEVCIDMLPEIVTATPNNLFLCNTGASPYFFDLTENTPIILASTPVPADLLVTYHETLADAEAGTSAITVPTAYTNTNAYNSPQTIYARVANGTADCYAIVDFDILANPLPEVVAVTDYTICEVNTDGFAQFDLSGKDAEVLNGQDPSRFIVSYHATQTGADNLTGALVSPYTNTGSPQRIYVAITDSATGCSISTPIFNIEVDNGAEANSDLDLIEQLVCDTLGDNDGLGQFDLVQNDAEVLDAGQDPADFTVTYYATQVNAELGVNPIPYIYENISNPQVVYARVDNETPDAIGMDSSICYAVTEVVLRVDLRPIFDLEYDYTLCIDTNGSEVIGSPVLDTGLDVAQYSFVWSLGGAVLPGETGPSLTATQGGNYSVVVANIVTGCTETDSTVVLVSSPPNIEVGVATQAFSEDHLIEAVATGEGMYEYSLDNGPWQDSGTFEGVTLGTHTVRARDVVGCGEASGSVTVLDYPQFFTPNGDGRNETWNIVGFAGQVNTKIYIFDRYGKLLKQISPSGPGWNGTFKGTPMPSSDYWFTVEYGEPLTGELKQFRSHFTLKR